VESPYSSRVQRCKHQARARGMVRVHKTCGERPARRRAYLRRVSRNAPRCDITGLIALIFLKTYSTKVVGEGRIGRLIIIKTLEVPRKYILSTNVPYGFASHTASRATFAKPPLKPPYFGAKQPTLALYRVLQPKILFRVYIYCLLTRTRIMPSLITLPTAPLSWLTSFSAHLLL
jgi:hypothetical protein